MTRSTFEPISSTAGFPVRHRRRRGSVVPVAVAAVLALGLTACGGDDDDSSATTSTTIASAVVATTAAPAPTTTVPPTTAPPTTVALVTEGATLIVANASGINGAAGRMSDALAVAGFSTGDATNSSEGQLDTSKVYYDSENPDAEAVANSVRDALGGGSIEVLEMGTPAPVESGEVGDASIVVAMGNDTADKSLDELQGLVTTPETSAPESAPPESSVPEG